MKKAVVAACMLLTSCGSVRVEEFIEDAVTPLEQACLRDPLDPQKWEQLAAALALAGERERAATMYLQAASLRKHDVQQDYVTLKQEVSDNMPRTQVRRVSAALVEVLRIPAAATTTAATSTTPAATVTLEISNGNGVAGALRTRRRRNRRWCSERDA